MAHKKGDIVAPAGALKEVVDFLSRADKETLRLLKSFLSSGTPVEDAKLLQSPRKVNKVYKDTLEVTLSKDFVWEEKKDYFTRGTDAVEGSDGSGNASKAPDVQTDRPLCSTNSGSSGSSANQDSK